MSAGESEAESEYVSPRVEEAVELADASMDAVNVGLDPDVFGDEITGSHRYLQQEFFDMVVKPAIISLADAPTDPRNERAVAEAQAIVAAMNWESNE